MPDIDLSQWLSTMYREYTAGREQEEARFGKGVEALESYADIFRPGGEYGAGIEAMIGRGEKKAVAGGMQSLVSAGLAGTTMPMHLQQTYQEEIGMPTRMRAEDVRMERLGGVMGSLGQMYAGYRSGAPSAGDIAHMATGGFGTMMQGRIADIQAGQRGRETYDPYPFGRFEDQFGAGGGGAGGGGGGRGGGGAGGGGGGDAAWGYEAFSPSGGGGGAGGFAEGELPVMMGGQRIEPGTETPYTGGMSEWERNQRQSAFPWRGKDGAGDIGSIGREDPFAPGIQTLAQTGLEWMYQ